MLLLDYLKGCRVVKPSVFKELVEADITEEHICIGVEGKGLSSLGHPVFWQEAIIPGSFYFMKKERKMRQFWFMHPQHQPCQVMIPEEVISAVKNADLLASFGDKTFSWSQFGITRDYWERFSDTLLSWPASLRKPKITIGLSGNLGFDPSRTIVLDVASIDADELVVFEDVRKQIVWLAIQSGASLWFDFEYPKAGSALFKLHIGSDRNFSVNLKNLETSIDHIHATLNRLTDVISKVNRGPTNDH